MNKESITVVTLLLFSATVSVKAENNDKNLEHLIRCMYHVSKLECSPTFSPDGKQVSFISSITGTKQVWTIPVNGGFPKLVTVGDTSVPHVEWSPIDKNAIVFSTSPEGSCRYQIYKIKPDGTELVRLSPGGKTRNFGANFTKNGKHLLVCSDARGKRMEPGLLDPLTGKWKWIMNANIAANFYDISTDSNLALLSDSEGYQISSPYLLNLKTKKRTYLFKEKPEHFTGTISPDGKILYVVTGTKGDRDVFGKIKINQDGSLSTLEVLSNKRNSDIGYSKGWDITNPSGTKAALIWDSENKSKLELIDLASGESFTMDNLPGRALEPKFSPDGKKLVLNIGGPYQPNNLWILDIESKMLKQITFFTHPGINYKSFVKPDFVKFKSFDNLELDGWLYKPKTSEKLPAYIIEFHGGPEGSSTQTTAFQPILSQGIGVLCPNVRGSSGRGKAFAALDDGPLRKNAIKDIKACVDYLVKNKIADPKRIGISGHSYGGYMAMIGLSKYPQLFAAGASDNGLVDILSYQKEQDEKGLKKPEWGDYKKDYALLKDLSPIFHVDRFRNPVLIQQGESDGSTKQFNRFVKKLKEQGVKVDYEIYPEEGHNYYKRKNKINAKLKLTQFFVEHLKPLTDS